MEHWLDNPNIEPAITLLLSAAIGLLVGLERERNPHAKAGLRTFALIALLGTFIAWLAQATGSGWLLGAGLLAVCLPIAGAYFADPATREDDSGTTTVIAALLVFALGAALAFGYRVLAVGVGIGMTALLHFKVELEGAARRLTPTDIRSILQFGAITAVALPLLPNEAYGPFGVLNPYQLWLMVVLISGVSLAGYVLWRFTAERAAQPHTVRRGLLLTGVLGGLVSSTATTLVHARGARNADVDTDAAAINAALLVILLANLTMLVRVGLLVALLAPTLLRTMAFVLVPALVLALPALIFGWRHSAALSITAPAQTLRNPVQLRTALVFAAMYALVLLLSAWLSERVGTQGVYAVALLSGLTDVDAITLSSLQLFAQGTLIGNSAAAAIALALSANLLFKTALVFFAGGGALGQRWCVGAAGTLLGLIAALVAVL